MASASNAFGSVIMNDDTKSIIVGIATGIISSILVTVWFRYVDSRHEAKIYFYEIAKYVRTLGKVFTPSQLEQKDQIDAIFDFLIGGETPRCYMWTFLSRKEKKLKDEFDCRFDNLFKYTYQLIECHRSILDGNEAEEVFKSKGSYEEKLREEWRKLIDCQGKVIDYLSSERLYR